MPGSNEVLPEGFAVARTNPEEYAQLAPAMQGFLSDTKLEAYARALDLPVRLDAPGNPTAVDIMEDEIALSTGISAVGGAAFIVARSTSVQEYDGLVGVAQFARTTDAGVAVEQFEVTPAWRTNGRVCAAILGFALRELEFTTADVLAVGLRKPDLDARSFWRSMEMHHTGNLFFDSGMLPSSTAPLAVLLEYAAPVSSVAAAVRSRLQRAT